MTVHQMTRSIAPTLVPFALFALVACATVSLQPGERPTPGSDEAGLWMQMDRAELTLRTSANLVYDPALNEYVRQIVCRLAGPHCDGLRVYIVRNPEFNASMAPNGMMLVWTGLLLRMENEAQLAFILGHELGHYLRRHALQQFRDASTKSAFLQ